MATDSRIDRLEGEVSQMGQRLAAVEAAVRQMGDRLNSIDSRLNTLTLIIFGNVATTILSAVGIVVVVVLITR